MPGRADSFVQKFRRDRQMGIRLKFMVAGWPHMMERKNHAPPGGGWKKPSGAWQRSSLQPGADQKTFDGTLCRRSLGLRRQLIYLPVSMVERDNGGPPLGNNALERIR